MSNHNLRRKFLKAAVLLPAGLPLARAAMNEDIYPLRSFTVKNQWSKKGQVDEFLVLVDTGTRNYSGSGYYLYPDWGEPVVYEVSGNGNRLAFRYPGMDGVLWEISADSRHAKFGGRVEAVIEKSNACDMQQLSGRYRLQPLVVPDSAPA